MCHNEQGDPERNGSYLVGDFKTLDASKSQINARLAGNDLDNTIIAGKDDASLWGGDNGDDLLIGGKGHNMFFYCNGNGHDTIQGINDGDSFILGDVSLDQIADTRITADSISVTSLTVALSKLTGVKMLPINSPTAPCTLLTMND